MNRFILTGIIKTIKYLPDAVCVYVDDMEKGYTRKDGVIVDDLLYTWKVIFKDGMKSYITKFFNDGMLVDIDARMRPYAVEKDKTVEGYSCIGLTIQRSCYVRNSFRQEIKMQRDSQLHTDTPPNLADYNKPDF